ncbi:MAG: Membrane protein, partial [Parcubacteria group bacterium GW2011_GWE1_40_20]
AVLLLPVVAVILLTQVGINIVSDKLVSQNPQTLAIEISDPLTGDVVKTITPIVVWPAKGVITLEFGESSKYQPFHTGIDIASKKGDPINPAMEGTVIYAGGDNIHTIYAHLDKIFVYKGQKVKTDTVIGHEGSTGWSTGNHLHFQVNVYGIPVNPRVFLGEGLPI